MTFKNFGQTTQHDIYLRDNNLVGIASEFNIPDIEWNRVDIETLGQVAVYKPPARPLQALDGSIKWLFAEPEIAGLINNPTKIHTFQVHSKADVWGPDGIDNEQSYTLVTICALLFHKTSFNAAKLGDLAGVESEFTCQRMSQRIHDSNEVLFSLDILANEVKDGSGDIWWR